MKNNFIERLNIYDGLITYNDFDIDEEKSFEEQMYSCKEDILQIAFGERFTLDVGWYPEMKKSGNFLVRGIQDFYWLEPVIVIKCRTLNRLKCAIEKVAQFLSERSKIKNLPFKDLEHYLDCIKNK